MTSRIFGGDIICADWFCAAVVTAGVKHNPANRRHKGTDGPKRTFMDARLLRREVGFDQEWPAGGGCQTFSGSVQVSGVSASFIRERIPPYTGSDAVSNECRF